MIGVLLDVSGSMRHRIDNPENPQGGSWARSIYKVVDELIKNDVSSDNRVFAIGVGAPNSPNIFDLLITTRNARSRQTRIPKLDTEDLLSRILDILEGNGAPYVRTWAKMYVLLDAVTHEQAHLLCTKLTDDRNFRSQFVADCLPDICRTGTEIRDVYRNPTKLMARGVLFGFDFVGQSESNFNPCNYKIHEDIRDTVRKGMQLIWNFNSVPITDQSIIGVHEASDILHGIADGRDMTQLTEEEVDKLMVLVEPFIYGRTPMVEALNTAKRLFEYGHRTRQNKVKKLLFILSDGDPTDIGQFSIPNMKELDVHVVCCYITKRLYH